MHGWVMVVELESHVHLFWGVRDFIYLFVKKLIFAKYTDLVRDGDESLLT